MILKWKVQIYAAFLNKNLLKWLSILKQRLNLHLEKFGLLLDKWGGGDCSKIFKALCSHWAHFLSFSKFVYCEICVEPCILFTDQRSTLNIEHGDLPLKLTNLQLDISNLVMFSNLKFNNLSGNYIWLWGVGHQVKSFNSLGLSNIDLLNKKNWTWKNVLIRLNQ